MNRTNEVSETLFGPAREVLAEAVDMYVSARRKFRPFTSAHEGFAVLLEEGVELWEQVMLVQPSWTPVEFANARKEALQIIAMATAFILEVCDNPPAVEALRLEETRVLEWAQSRVVKMAEVLRSLNRTPLASSACFCSFPEGHHTPDCTAAARALALHDSAIAAANAKVMGAVEPCPFCGNTNPAHLISTCDQNPVNGELPRGHYWVYFDNDWRPGVWDGEDWDIQGTTTDRRAVILGPRWEVPAKPTRSNLRFERIEDIPVVDRPRTHQDFRRGGLYERLQRRGRFES